jgi:serine/threonine protein phosphatase PrpC
MEIRSFGYTHQGYYRQRNEDALLVQPERGLWVVCDGMGGHQAGDYASNWIVERLSDVELPARVGGMVNALKTSLTECNRHLREHARSNDLGQIGSTVALLVIHSDRAMVLWAGDSRVYRLRNGKLRQMTEDHSYAREVARNTGKEMEDGQPGSQAITRAVGANDELQLDCLVLEARPGDVWVLCSDGVSGSLDKAEMIDVLDSAEDPARALVERALENDSRDNCTAISVHIHDSHLSAPSSSTEYM